MRENPIVPAFGSALQDVVREDGQAIPIVITTLCEHLISTEQIKTEGLFRVPALKSSLQKFKLLFNKRYPVDLKGQNPHLLADLLKEFLRQLPEPLLTFEAYPKWLFSSTINEEQLKLAYMRSLLASLPPPNLALAEYLVNFFVIAHSFRETNQLTIDNLTTLFGPLFLSYNPSSLADAPSSSSSSSKKKKKPEKSPNVGVGGAQNSKRALESFSIMEQMREVNNITKLLILRHSLIFNNVYQSGFTYVKAKTSNNSKQANELKFKKGDIIAVFHQPSKTCWYGECRQSIGSFDPSLVSKIDSSI